MCGTLVIDCRMTDQKAMLDSLFDQLDSSDAVVRKGARDALRNHGAAIDDRLLNTVQQHHGYKSFEAAQLLLEMRRPAVDDIILDMLTSPHPMIGHLAFEYLENYNNPACVAHLLKALPYAIPTVQMRIISQLSKQRRKEALHTLIAVLRSTQSVSVQAMTMDALAALGDYRAAVFIQPFTHHDNPHIRTAAQSAVANLALP